MRVRWIVGLTALSLLTSLLAGFESGRRGHSGVIAAVHAGLVVAVRGDPTFVNQRYGYRLQYPAGWQEEDLMGVLGDGPATSPDVIFYPSRELRWQDVAMGVRICAATGPRIRDCLPSHSEIRSQAATALAGQSGTVYTLERFHPREVRRWWERHTLVERAGQTVQVWASWPESPPWSERVPAAYQAMIRSFRWTQ